ncbi:MAG TPA: NAD(P)H-binding protein [Actinomycetota bacterium]|nr:NAD(P)H-binding protein [Actinomycetota bacterium]
MPKPLTVAVTGATGRVGSRVVDRLLDGHRSVVALARRPAAIRPRGGLVVRFADYDDPRSLVAGLAGVDTLVFISSDGVAESMGRHHEHVVAASIRAGVRRVVYTSILDDRPGSRFYYAPVHRVTEARLAASGLRQLIARTSIFAEFFLDTWLAPALRDGELALPDGGGAMSLVTCADVAAGLATAAVGDRDGVVRLTGPEALTAAQVTEIAGAAVGRPLAYRPLDDAGYRRRLAAEGTPDWLIEAYASMFTSVRQGRFAAVSPDVATLTGHPAGSFASFLSSLGDRRLGGP